MSIVQVRNVEFGERKTAATGSTGVGYALLLPDGTPVVTRTTVGVTEVLSGSGIYSAPITIPDAFKGIIMWDTGAAFSRTYYASEEFNYDQGDPNSAAVLAAIQSITGSVERILSLTEGRWKIENNQMKFFEADNTTLIATYNLFDENGNPTMGGVFERVKV